MKKVKVWAALLGASTLAASYATAADNSAKESNMTGMEKHHHGPHLVSTISENDFATTLTKLQAAIDARAFKTFAVVDHAKGAASIDADLRPTTLIIFGNPKGGTPLIQAAQTMGIFLPLKALVYENADGSVAIATSDIRHALKEHGVADKDPLADKIAGALDAISAEAAQADAAQ